MAISISLNIFTVLGGLALIYLVIAGSVDFVRTRSRRRASRRTAD